MPGRAAHQRVQTRAQFLHVERLRQVVVGAGFETDHLVLPVRTRGQNQDRQAAAETAQCLDHRDAVAFRQAEVDDGGVVFELASEIDAFVAIGGRIDDVARILEIFDELGAQPRIVFDHQHAHRTYLESIQFDVRLRLPCESTDTVLTRPPSSSTLTLYPLPSCFTDTTRPSYARFTIDAACSLDMPFVRAAAVVIVLDRHRPATTSASMRPSAEQ